MNKTLSGCSVDNLYSTVAVPCYFPEANSLIKKISKLISTQRRDNFASYSTCYVPCAFKLQSKLVPGCIAQTLCYARGKIQRKLESHVEYTLSCDMLKGFNFLCEMRSKTFFADNFA